MKDPTSQLRSATRRAKSDVANKLVSMFLHELSRRISRDWALRVESEEYETFVRSHFGNRCPYCSRDLSQTGAVVEHLDGLNRYRAGLHVAGNVLVACRSCNIEKRRDDSLKKLSLASSGWESFLVHDGSKCPNDCLTCAYWARVWEDQSERSVRLQQNRERIRAFRSKFGRFEELRAVIDAKLPTLLGKLYMDCQDFAQREIRSLLESFDVG